jgi:hypothetical protein
MNRPTSLRGIISGAALLVSTAGCSVYSALTQPPYIDFGAFKLGEQRMRVSEFIGAPKSSVAQAPDNHLVDYHEFTSGTPGATRLRAIGYIIGDAFSFGLGEVIFWPVELTIAKPHDFKAHFSYDRQECVNGYRIVNGDGTVAQQDGVLAH